MKVVSDGALTSGLATVEVDQEVQAIRHREVEPCRGSALASAHWTWVQTRCSEAGWPHSEPAFHRIHSPYSGSALWAERFDPTQIAERTDQNVSRGWNG
eukprot:7382744-Prymnesium_polylepis.1